MLRALDKLPKIGREAVIAEMTGQVGATARAGVESARLRRAQGDAGGDSGPRRRNAWPGSERGEMGVARLRELFDVCRKSGLPEERIRLDVSIARGLDYYTGTIYETFLNDDGRSAASARAGATTTWRRCSRSSRSRASARAWGSIGCWRRWRTWGW